MPQGSSSLSVVPDPPREREYPEYITHPPDGWLADYVDLAGKSTDAPRIYHVVTGLTLLAVGAGNRLFVSRWSRRVFLNIWTVLVGPSTRFRKTTSITMGMQVLKRCLPHRIYPHSFTVEALQSGMGKMPAGVLEASELAVLTSELQRDYNKGAMSFLTRAYDGESYTRSTRKDGNSEVIHPAPSILAASTPEWLVRGMKATDVAAGWLPRFLVIQATEKEAEPDDAGFYDSDAQQRLSDRLLAISRMEGALRLDGAAERLFRGFERDLQAKVDEGALPPEYGAFYGRRLTDALKIACLHRLSRGALQWTVEVDDMAFAVAFVGRTMPPFIKLMQQELAFSKSGEHVAMIRRMLRQAPGEWLYRSQVLYKVQSAMSVREADAALMMMLESGEMITDRKARARGRFGPHEGPVKETVYELDPLFGRDGR